MSKTAAKRGRKQEIRTAKFDFILADARADYEKRLEEYRADAKEARRIARARATACPAGKKSPPGVPRIT